LFETACLIGSNAKHSPWGVALNETQRMALEADATFYTKKENASEKGIDNFKASRYQR